ncbi:S-layer homology domain-containing protein [Paenibacillus sp. YYML68]|uniref:S-layer homology domain-containing protein n=1 Tax=Paenibacillus sp. YYML68 TaxID=2909250 RepID=UPI002492C546|nr:S-layer homology domain-containing protein [Paenibacillus sp. YYML68]
MKNKLMLTTLSVGLLYSSLMVVPGVELGLYRSVYAATTPSQKLNDEIKRIVEKMTPEDRKIVLAAQDKVDALKSDLNNPDNQKLIQPIWARVEAKKGTSPDYPNLTKANILNLVLHLSYPYDQQGSGLNDIITKPELRAVADELIRLAGQDGLNYITIDDIAAAIDKLQSNVTNRFKAMTLNELLNMATDPVKAENVVEEELNKVIGDNSLKVSNVLSTIGIRGSDITDVIRLFRPRVDPDRKAMIAWVKAVIAAEGLGNGSGNGEDSGSGSGGGTTGGTPGGTTTAPFNGTLGLGAATVTQVTKNGVAVNVVELKSEQLKAALDDLASGKVAGKVLTLDLGATKLPVDVKLDAAVLAAAASSGITLKIVVDGITLQMPLNIFANAAGAANDRIVFELARIDEGDTMYERIQKAAALKSSKVVKPIYQFSIKRETASGTRTNITDYKNQYVPRTWTMNSSVNASRTTAVWFNPANDKLSFVPSVFSGGSSTSNATISSLHDAIFATITREKEFADLSSHWSKSDVEMMASKLVVDGVSEDTFSPEASVTRAEFAALLVRALGLLEAPAGSTFKDVQASAWYSGSVEAAAKAGLIEGFEDGTFKPDATIQREQLFVMLERAAKYVGQDIKVASNGNHRWEQFVDTSLVSPWAADAVKKSLQADIIQGVKDYYVRPQETATRAQAAVLLKRLLDHLKFID